MSVIVNEIEVVAPPPNPEENQPPDSEVGPGPTLTAHDLYWIKRKLAERQTRLAAR